jgi:hypothetical protein
MSVDLFFVWALYWKVLVETANYYFAWDCLGQAWLALRSVGQLAPQPASSFL